MAFNYGAFPQTWEDPDEISPHTNHAGMSQRAALSSWRLLIQNTDQVMTTRWMSLS